MRLSAQNKGFTLIELLLVVSLIAVLSTFLLPGFSNYIDLQNIRQGQESLKSDLRTVQNKALTGVGSSNSLVQYWGLKVPSDNANNYFYFQSTTADGPACDLAEKQETSVNLPSDVVIMGAGGACVFFSLRNGDATIMRYAEDTIYVGYAGDEACYGVQINSAGMIRGVDEC